MLRRAVGMRQRRGQIRGYPCCMPGRGSVGMLIAAALLAAAAGPAAAATIPPAPPAATAFAEHMDSGLAAVAGGQVSLRQAERRDGLTVKDGRVLVLVLSAPNRS